MIVGKCHEGFILKVSQDQHQELADFYRSIEKRAYRMAVMETRNISEAIDLVQDAMEALMRRYSNRPKDEWRPIFYRILQNKIRDWQRRSAVLSRLYIFNGNQEDTQDLLETQVSSGEVTPDENAQNEISMEKLQAALNKLSSRQRQTFLLRVWEGFNVNETAKIMKCSAGSVKTHLSRALSSLKDQLREWR